MTRILALAVSFLTVAAMGVSAQSHPQPHPQGRPHDSSGHAPMDPEEHAALHALIGGDWHGTVTTPSGESSPLELRVSKNERGIDDFALTGAPSLHIGGTSQVAVQHHRIRWVQAVSGESCRATADIVAATVDKAEVLKGVMSCAQRDLTFALTKATK